MKKITFPFAALTGALLLASSMMAQSDDKTLAFRNIRPVTGQFFFDPTATEKPFSTEMDTNSVSAARASFKKSKAEFKMAAAADRSAAHVRKQFHHAAASWEFNDNGMFATFMENGLKTRVDFDKKGRWIHTYTYSLGNGLCPAAFRKITENYYPDAVILYTIRVEEGAVTGYVLTLEDFKTYRTVYIDNDNVIVMHEVTKS
jgi:hypothetical protein